MDSNKFRILVVDDLISIHDDFKKILTTQKNPLANEIKQVSAQLFDKPTETTQDSPFIVDSAFQGKDAIELVKNSVEENDPYAVAFVDVLMPPGIDGIETIFCMWSIDPNIQIVICTAYSIYTWEEISRRLGETDQLYIIKKPFEKIEILNLAHTLSKRWAISRLIKKQLAKIEAAISCADLTSRIDIKESLEKINSAVEKLKNYNESLKNVSVMEIKENRDNEIK